MKAAKVMRTALIGAGNMGKNHARVYSEISQFSGIADVVETIGRPLAQKYGVSFYTDYIKMIDEIKPDAVSVVVPTRFHKQVTIDCLKRHIPVLVEKPIALTVDEASEMIEASKKENTFLMVGHIERFNPAVIKLKKIIDQGKLGKIINLLAIRVGISPPRIPNSDVALDLGIHDVDVFNYLLNSFPTSKKIVKHKLFKHNTADSASLFLEYKDTSAMIQTNWITPIKMRKLFVTGSEGFVELDYLSQKITYYNKIINSKIDGNFYEFLSLSETPKREIFVSKKEPLKEEIECFLSYANNKKDKLNPVYALKALENI